jgi:hypothetical protein
MKTPFSEFFVFGEKSDTKSYERGDTKSYEKVIQKVMKTGSKR